MWSWDFKNSPSPYTILTLSYDDITVELHYNFTVQVFQGQSVTDENEDRGSPDNIYWINETAYNYEIWNELKQRAMLPIKHSPECDCRERQVPYNVFIVKYKRKN